jgi:oxygen-dependent protoporphyrinogen oxidase
MNTHQTDRHVIIIGGGITGLIAGWYLQQGAAQQNIDLSYTILEASGRWGGKVQTEQVHEFGDMPFILEAGPDAFLTRKPWALELARELDMSGRILPVNMENSRTFVLSQGKPIPLPDGLQLLAPTRLMPFLRSPLFSPWGKVRAGLDLFIPARRSEDDETLANFVRRRLGAEMLDKLGEPLLAGVYNNDPERQSMRATFPQFPALEKKHGSLIRGGWQREPVANSEPPFISFKSGTHELVDALVSRLEGDLRLNTAVACIERDSRYCVITAVGSVIEAESLIIATPANVTAKLLAEIAPETSKQLDTIPYTGIGAIYFAFRREDVPHPLKGFGLVVPGSEGRQFDGITWVTSKWADRAPSGFELLRIFFGGPRTPQTLHMDDRELIATMRAELKSIFGIAAEPLFHRVFRWQDGYPQYNIGHLERVASAEAALPAGIFLAGSAYRGVGVPDCIRQGRDAANQAISAINLQTA